MEDNQEISWIPIHHFHMKFVEISRKHQEKGYLNSKLGNCRMKILLVYFINKNNQGHPLLDTFLIIQTR